MVIIDVSFISTFYRAEAIDSYQDLMSFFRRIESSVYINGGIYVEDHDNVKLPLFFHFRAHLFQARESHNSNDMKDHYRIAYDLTQEKLPFIEELFKWFSDEVEEVRNGCQICVTKLQRYSRNRPEAHNLAISEGKKGKPNGHKHRRVLHINTGIEYDSPYEAFIQTGFAYNSIRACCNGMKQCRGQQWAYLTS